MKRSLGGNLEVERKALGLYGIDRRKTGQETVRVDLWGEFDLSSREDLQKTLRVVADSREPTLVDLSRITFLDIQSARELAVYSRLYRHYFSLRNPSWQVRASFDTCGLDTWFYFDCDRADSPPVLSDRPE